MNDYTTNPWLPVTYGQQPYQYGGSTPLYQGVVGTAPAPKQSILAGIAGGAQGSTEKKKESGGLGSLLDGAIPGLSEATGVVDWLIGQHDKEENKKIARASWSAEQGPAMLKMIQDMAKRQDENRFRSTGLSTLAGR